MKFEWDDAKNEVNIRKHGIDFIDVEEMFEYPMLAFLDDREDYTEDRWIGVGWIKSLVGVVVYVERHNDSIRIISARKALKHEVRLYEKNIKN